MFIKSFGSVFIILLILKQFEKSMDVLERKQNKNPPATISKLVKPDKMYALLNIFQLEISRLHKLPIFQQLVSQLRQFNTEIEQWKQNKHQIKNHVTTYHLYENLSSRLKYLTNISRSEQESIHGAQEISKWFFAQKPKIRCLVKETKASIPNCILDSNQKRKLQDMVQYSELQRELQPYKMMSRTMHPGTLPPKQILKEYKRKTFLPFEESQQKSVKLAVKKSWPTSLNKNKFNKNRQSVGTLATTNTMNGTDSSFKKTVSQFKIPEVAEQRKVQPPKQDTVQVRTSEGHQPILQQTENQEQKQVDEQGEQQKRIDQQKLADEKMIKDQGMDDEGEENLIGEEEEMKNMKIYISDHDKEMREYSQQISKEAKESSIRRVIKINEDKIRSKLQDVDLKRNVTNWGKAKGKNASEYSQKLEKNLHFNKYKQIGHRRASCFTQTEINQLENHEKKYFNATTGFTQKRPNLDSTHNKAQVVPILYRSKSQHPASIESDIKKIRLEECMKTYGRYINHIPSLIVPKDTNSQNKQDADKKEESQSKFRSTSLTNLTNHTIKKKTFSAILMDNNPDSYNELVQEQLVNMKTTLSTKLIPLQKKALYNGLSVTAPEETGSKLKMPKTGKDLLSNPFFPVFPTKKKKK